MFKRNRLELAALALAKIIGMAAVGCGYLGHRYLGMTLFVAAGSLIIFIVVRCIRKMELISLFAKDDLLNNPIEKQTDQLMTDKGRETIVTAVSNHIKYQITDGADRSQNQREETLKIMDAIIEELQKARKAESEGKL